MRAGGKSSLSGVFLLAEGTDNVCKQISVTFESEESAVVFTTVK